MGVTAEYSGDRYIFSDLDQVGLQSFLAEETTFLSDIKVDGSDAAAWIGDDNLLRWRLRTSGGSDKESDGNCCKEPVGRHENFFCISCLVSGADKSSPRTPVCRFDFFASFEIPIWKPDCLLLRCSRNILLPVCQATRGGEKTGMSDHAMLRPNAHSFDVPKAHQSFQGFDTRKPLVVSERIYQSFH